MAFTPEDGTGLEDANSFIDVQTLDDYAADRGIDISGFGTSEKEDALVLVTDYIDNVFGPATVGRKKSREQALNIPRTGMRDIHGYLVPDDEVPREYQNATAELGLVQLTGSNELWPNVAAGEAATTKLRDKLDVMETEREFSGGSGSASSPIYRKTRGFLYPLLRSGFGQPDIVT